MNWDESKLGDVAKVISGYAFKSKDFSENKGVPVIKIKNIQKEKVEISDDYFLDESFLSINSKFHCVKDDVLISLTGSHITLPNSVVGRVAKYQYDFTSLLNQRGGKIVVTDKNKLVNNYLYYYLCQHEVRTTLALFGRGGANQVNISPSNVESIKIDLPPLQTQKRIASILSAYDDLIENNLKRIELLEKAAQNIYKEWFVNLRFPDYKNISVNEETGLPEGWEEKEIGSIITFLGGYAFKSKTYIENGKYRVITIKNVGDKVFDTSVGNSVDSIPDKMKEHCKIIEGDILLSLTGNVGRSCIAYGENNLLNQRVAKIVSTNKNWLPYIYWMFNDNKMFSLMNSLATGAAQQNLSPVKLAKEKFVIPCESIIKLYCLKANSVFKQIVLLNKQNQKLKASRDILLPRLMNRTIEV